MNSDGHKNTEHLTIKTNCNEDNTDPKCMSECDNALRDCIIACSENINGNVLHVNKDCFKICYRQSTIC